MNDEKITTITIKGVKYSGASIGDDIRIRIEALGNVVSIDKKIKNGSEIALDSVVGQSLTGELRQNFSAVITIVELDPIFNDIGSVRVNVSIDPTTKSQKSTHRVVVKESRGRILPSGSLAFFDVTFELVVEPAYWYVVENGQGWLKVQRDDKLPDISIPVLTKVKINKRTSKREYFKIMEGANRGVDASRVYKKDGASYFTLDNHQTKTVHATYSISRKILTINDKTYKTKDYESSTWMKGVYDIEIPDFPHAGGRHYLIKAPHALVWFRVGHSGDRYIHVGTNSLGCITMVEHGRWEEIYKKLIGARRGDGMSAGELEIVD